MTEKPPLRARCRRCKKQVEFPHPSSKAISGMDWPKLVLRRTRQDAEYAHVQYQTQPKRVVEELFACTCGGPYEIRKP